MITALKNEDTITIRLFGEEKEVCVFSTGDNQFDENGDDKEDDFDLSEEELEVLNWFLDNVKIEDYKKEIMEHCNERYSAYCDKEITIDDVEDEIDIDSIAINVTENWKANDGFIYPEIAFFGSSLCDEEEGICIGFRDKKFLGIDLQNWIL